MQALQAGHVHKVRRPLYRRPPTRAYRLSADLSRVRGRVHFICDGPDLAFPLELLNVKAYTRCDLESDPSTGGNHKGAVEFVELSLFSRGECGEGWELGIRSQDRELFDHKLQIGFMLEAFW